MALVELDPTCQESRAKDEWRATFYSVRPRWVFFATSLVPLCIPGFREKELPGFRGGKEEAKRQIRGEKYVPHTDPGPPSRHAGEPVTFFEQPGWVDGRFAVSIQVL